MTPEQLQKLGITLYRYPTPAGQPPRVFYGDNGTVSGSRGMGEITDPLSLGIEISSLPDVTRIPESTYGGTSKSNFNPSQLQAFSSNLQNQVTEKEQVQAEEKRVQDLNAFIDQYRGTQTSVEVPKELDPTGQYTIYNGAFVRKENVPSLQGTTSVDGNIVGAPAVAPSGTAGAQLQEGIASGAVSPTNVEQQVQASLTGSNVNAPGIDTQLPVTPAPQAPVQTSTQAPAQPVIDPALAQFNQQVVGNTIPQAPAPQQINVGTPEAPLMVPAGSAGAQLSQGIQQGTVSPTNPEQQMAASVTGNNTTAPGIVPSAPTPAAPQPLAPAVDGQIPVQVGSGIATIPEGSAAAQLAQGISTGAVSPTNPDQQMAASLTGNNVNAPGIVPSSPTPAQAPVDPTLATFNQQAVTATPGATTQPGGVPANSGAQGASTGLDATLGQNPTQVGGKFGTQNFGRIGNDVYEIMSDGSYRKVSEAEFMNTLKAKGLNLDVLPQLSPADTLGTPSGPANPDINTDGTPKTPSSFVSDYAGIVKELGLTSLKQTIEDMNKDYQELQDKKVSEIGDVNMNPWLSEGLRSKKIANINSQYESREANLTARLQLQNALYEEGIAQAKFLTSGLQEDRNKLLDLAMKREEAEAKLDQQEFENRLDLENLTLDQKKFALDQWKANRSNANSSGTGTVKITPANKTQLLGAGFSTTEIDQIQRDVNAYGLNKVLEGLTNEAQRKALRGVYGATEKVTLAQLQSSVTQKAAQDGLRDNYTENELIQFMKDAGFASIWSSRESELEKYLNSSAAKTKYVDFLYNQYKTAGMAD